MDKHIDISREACELRRERADGKIAIIAENENGELRLFSMTEAQELALDKLKEASND